jgi:4-carboxymuconolactone decarboxylase
MTLRRKLAIWSGIVTAAVLAGNTTGRLAAQNSAASRASTLEQYNASLPNDVYPDSRSRFPLIRRESLSEQDKKTYDSLASSNTASLAGLQGPGGLRLHGSGKGNVGKDLGRRMQELARLVVAREFDQSFEWTVHEPVALKEGLDPKIIDVIRYRKPLDGVAAKERAIIQLGREVFQTHKVRSETFAAALKQLGEKNLIDLCDLMGSYATTAIMLHTVDVHLPFDRPPLLPIP